VDGVDAAAFKCMAAGWAGILLGKESLVEI